MARSIADIRIHPISVPLERAFWMSLEPYTMAAEIVVEIETDDGLVGIGEIHGRPQGEIADILESAFKPLLIGEDPLDHERLWELLFRLTFSRAAARFAAADGQPHSARGQAAADGRDRRHRHRARGTSRRRRPGSRSTSCSARAAPPSRPTRAAATTARRRGRHGQPRRAR